MTSPSQQPFLPKGLISHPLAKEIALVLAIKLVLITGIKFAFFSSPQHVDEEQITDKLFAIPENNGVNATSNTHLTQLGSSLNKEAKHDH